MPDTFTIVPTVGTRGEITHRVLSIQFGDGYSQRMANGLNARGSTWNLSFVGKDPKISNVLSFLDAHKGYISFNWTPPKRVTPGLFVAAQYSLIDTGAGIYQVDVTFTEVFSP